MCLLMLVAGMFSRWASSATCSGPASTMAASIRQRVRSERAVSSAGIGIMVGSKKWAVRSGQLSVVSSQWSVVSKRPLGEEGIENNTGESGAVGVREESLSVRK